MVKVTIGKKGNDGVLYDMLDRLIQCYYINIISDFIQKLIELWSLIFYNNKLKYWLNYNFESIRGLCFEYSFDPFNPFILARV